MDWVVGHGWAVLFQHSSRRTNMWQLQELGLVRLFRSIYSRSQGKLDRTKDGETREAERRWWLGSQ